VDRTKKGGLDREKNPSRRRNGFTPSLKDKGGAKSHWLRAVIKIVGVRGGEIAKGGE